ncbi:DUF2726 domain-containing protein [Sphingobium vermicomposti]|uniref:DUF2726 domain-containing protein n=1 Tax=Sphingobium vermicomposti TaxID=529005 RepID=A0A846M412_9SPHN|nr:DUF2726 domain-containing protein [Sphingobium vermicomposti]NIJ16649.1 hypothetical protein [Sphingobium vermicomposti]
MLKELDAMLDMPITLFVVLAVGAIIGIAFEKAFAAADREKRRAYWRGRNSAKKITSRTRFTSVSSVETAQSRDSTQVAAEQLKVVMNADFQSRALLNKPERRLLDCIDQVLADECPGWRAMGQVSLGEILYSRDKDAFWAINAKRVDLLIVDRDCRPLHAVEFQGTGHHGSPETAARDAIKKEALRRAGIGYVEVVSGNTPAEVRDMVRKLANVHKVKPAPPAA